MKNSLSLIILFSIFATCGDNTQKSKQVSEAVYAAGTVKAARLVSVFNQTCLTHFPEGEATVSAFKSLGFTVAESTRNKKGIYSWRLSHDEEKISAFIGKETLTWHGPNFTAGQEEFLKCEISADLSDLDAIDVALLNLKTSNGALVGLKEEKESPTWRGGIVANSDKGFRVAFHQPKRREYVQRGRRPKECGDLEGCLIWGRSELSISAAIP